MTAYFLPDKSTKLFCSVQTVVLQIPLLPIRYLLKPDARDARRFDGFFHSGSDVETSSARFEMPAHEKIEYGLIDLEYNFNLISNTL